MVRDLAENNEILFKCLLMTGVCSWEVTVGETIGTDKSSIIQHCSFITEPSLSYTAV